MIRYYHIIYYYYCTWNVDDDIDIIFCFFEQEVYTILDVYNL